MSAASDRLAELLRKLHAAEVYAEDCPYCVALAAYDAEKAQGKPACGKCGRPWDESHANVSCGGAGPVHTPPPPDREREEVEELLIDLQQSAEWGSFPMEPAQIRARIMAFYDAARAGGRG